MNSRDQQVMVDYSRAGGHLVIFPCLPDREMSQKPCTILRDAISIKPTGREVIDSPLIDIFDLKDIKCANPQLTYSEDILKGADIIARTIKGTPCGFTKVLERGVVTHLGTWMGFDTEGHKPAYEALLRKSGAKLRQAASTNENITVRERFTGEGSALLFIGNYYNEEQTGRVTYTHPVTGEAINIPYTGDELTWPALYGVLTPVCMEVAEGINILHSTSDILSIIEKDGILEITLFGDRDLHGEIVFEGIQAPKINAVTINGESIRLINDGERVAISYYNMKYKELLLRLKLY
jgi:beta-galactosidase